MLDDEAIERYSRQIVVPGIGAAGQEALLRSRVLVVGDPRGTAAASLYLRAAGLQVLDRFGADGPGFDVAVLADVRAVDPALLERILESGRPLCWYATDDEGGFASGIHPGDALPPPPAAPPLRGTAVHDAAACDVAATACALRLGLPLRGGPASFPA